MIKKISLIPFLLWLILIASLYFHTTDVFDQDMGRHLKLGEIIWQTKEVPKLNLFSYTAVNEPVFNSHWGSQVVFYIIHQFAGTSGLIVFSTLVNTAAFGLLFFFVTRRAGILLASTISVPFLPILLDRTWVRPEMFGNLFYAIILIALFSKRVRYYAKWFFPLIALLWINLHITAVFGVFAMVVVLFQDSFDLLRSSERHDSKTSLKWNRFWTSQNDKVQKGIFTNVLIGCFILAFLFINPYGFDGVRMAFTVLNKYGYTIVENQSWLFLRDFGFSFVNNIAIGFVLLIFSYMFTVTRLRRPFLGEVTLLVVVSILTLRFVRNEILFAYTAYLVSSLNLARFQKLRVRSVTTHTFFLFVATYCIGAALIYQAHALQGLPFGVGNKESYRKGVDFFLANNLPEPIFNNFDIGGYLIYRLYPKTPVFVDNRPEAYPVNFFQNTYIPMQIEQTKFDTFTQQYKFKTIIWGVRDITPWSKDFLDRITKDPAWKTVYLDDAIIILTKK